MIVHFLILLVSRYTIKENFIDYDYHTLFRSFFCLLISISSLSISLINWNDLIADPLSSNIISKQINKKI